MSANTQQLLQAVMNDFFHAVSEGDLSKVNKYFSDNLTSTEISIKNNINYKDPANGMTALHHAAMTDKKELTQHLLAQGADPTITDNHQQTPAHIAAGRAGNLEILKELLQKNNTLLYVIDAEGSTPLHIASFDGQDEIVAHLLSVMTNSNQKDKQGRTALHQAALNRKSSTIKLLIPEINIFIRDNDLKPALDAASFKEDDHHENRKMCIESLLDAYAAIFGDISSRGIEYVDFSGKMLISLKIDSLPIGECIASYSEKYPSLNSSIYSKEQLTKAVSSGKIDKNQLMKIIEACQQQKSEIEKIPHYKETQQYIDELQQINELIEFTQTLATKSASVFANIKHFVLGDKKPAAAPTSSEAAATLPTIRPPDPGK